MIRLWLESPNNGRHSDNEVGQFETVSAGSQNVEIQARADGVGTTGHNKTRGHCQAAARTAEVAEVPEFALDISPPVKSSRERAV